jgi:hypothetical protein
MDLLAATTFPDAQAGTIQAEIVGDVPLAGPLRLVVQSYENGSDSPIGSVQRAVTASDLRHGVHVRLVELRDLGARTEASRVVAWVERGRPDLEFDARTARPSAGAFYGEARGSDVRIVLRRAVRAA